MSKQFYTNLINPNLTYNTTSGSVANPMTATLDASENSIVNLPAPSTNGEPVTLGYFNDNVPNVDTFIANPLTTNLNANNFEINNLSAMSMKDAIDTLVTYYVQTGNGSIITTNASDNTDLHLHIAINEAGPTKPYYTDFRNHPVTNVGSLGFNDGGIITKSSSTFQFNQPLDLNNNYMKDIQNLQFYNGGSLRMDLSDNLLYNDDIVVTSANIDTYIAQANWEPTAGSDLNMNTHNIIFSNENGGKIYPNGQLGISALPDTTLSYGGQKVVVSQCDPSATSLSFTEYQPSTAVNINVVGGFPIAVTTSVAQSNTDLNKPWDISLSFSIDATNDIDFSTAYVIIGLCDQSNPVTSDHVVQYLKIMGSAFTYDATSELYYVRIRSDDVNPLVQVVTAWTSVWSTLTVSTAYVYVSMYAENSASANVYIEAFNGTINFPNSTHDKDFYVAVDSTQMGNGIVPINRSSAFLQTYQGVQNVPQVNGENILFTIQIPDAVDAFHQTVLIKSTVISVNFCVKSTCCITGGAIISNTASSLIVFNTNDVLRNIIYQFDGSGNVQIVTTLATVDIYNNATVKVKLLVVDDV